MTDIISALGSLGPLGGMLGGGKTKVTQNSSNQTSLQLPLNIQNLLGEAKASGDVGGNTSQTPVSSQSGGSDIPGMDIPVFNATSVSDPESFAKKLSGVTEDISKYAGPILLVSIAGFAGWYFLGRKK